MLLTQAFLSFSRLPEHQLRYHDSMADAVADLGRPDAIGKMFRGFQKYLYKAAA